jgi:hypothetical protein
MDEKQATAICGTAAYPSRTPKAPRYTNYEWEKHKARIEQLYVKDGRRLKDVMATLRHESDFTATYERYHSRYV